MRLKATLPVLLLMSAFVLAAYAADETKAPRKEGEKHAALEQFTQLAGEWVGKEISGGPNGPEMRVQYKVTSAGSAVVETLFPSGEEEMITVIHQDGDDLALTHYCALGNQPHMKSKGKGDGNKVAFTFSGASNLKSDKDMHMHEVTYTFVDKDNLKSEWTHYNGGKPAGTAIFVLKRKK